MSPFGRTDPPSVLIVDDCPDTVESTGELLRLLGFPARLALSAEEALELAADRPADIVLLDLMLPGIDGFELARRLRAGSGRRPLLLVAVTGCDTPEHRRGAAAAGIDRYLVKPVAVDALVAVLESVRVPQPLTMRGAERVSRLRRRSRRPAATRFPDDPEPAKRDRLRWITRRVDEIARIREDMTAQCATFLTVAQNHIVAVQAFRKRINARHREWNATPYAITAV